MNEKSELSQTKLNSGKSRGSVWNLKNIGTVIFTLLLLLIFASKTIYTYHLPVVTAVSPVNGKLEKSETVKGIVEWSDKVNLYAETGGKVEEILVEEGDPVIKGQPLVRLSPTKEDLAAGREKSYELRQLEQEIKNAEEDLGRLEVLYREGAIAKNQYDTALRNLQSLYNKKEKILLDYQDSLANLDQDMLIVYAVQDSIIVDIAVNQGEIIKSSQLVAVCGKAQQYEMICNISLDNNFVSAGDSCELENSSHTLDGIVTRVTPVDQGKEVTIAIQSEEATAGETFDVTFEKESAESHILVPNGALNMDSDGYFLYQVKQRDGMLGKEFYVEKLRVYIGDEDHENTVISKGITFFEPVVLLSNKGLSNGETVKLENEGDFFAD
ncbi:efflux RND transporter periplasmic adaptor subunit [Sinanaerobacter chloroacetimidivorans]|uniref:Efflux RND transporter periplasmic adaptor subunit n=1 Tax=Sinanaerobacter chloroacetimidivorans TaxID=2818044 RepID=A0A8J7W2F5_9FIRM|nr:efflux RND transporter periplasmic adaptor subunit [Sinanaerobacter chloroacetimidivorans]MBR0599654.1 efflux RND transporter periplasmic adaptor subunit [Sinanaerobacter chloroacetimidivorans]